METKAQQQQQQQQKRSANATATQCQYTRTYTHTHTQRRLRDHETHLEAPPEHEHYRCLRTNCYDMNIIVAMNRYIDSLMLAR
ncbi:hypothetical protein AWZ03_000844 [Drosophila navojoa]|uniref:Uncharacterized protein n=1 Tax=Drosophila navojoa TaxID=7232 RepID=A0A484BY18_DRONA|nr:hypothetical protein AWZ03_000844 [Drosophila navojoa]